ncbi:hypothetical protein F444_10562 [Phytophthora nicotianae P1976]|uniref:Uncharacterized protein n=1 Tax=Phytophthora nicotianae P1976 TaxID=1317066 RepID=A0A081A3N3_PHYNI|nr:hypothetical protein F444_10562 [Phytophthora nicotianae P1976]
MPLRLDTRSEFCLPWLSAKRLKGRCRLLRPLVPLIVFLDLFDRPSRASAEALRLSLQLLRRALILTVARAFPADPVLLASATQMPPEVTVVLRSRVVPRTSSECRPVLCRTPNWRFCPPLFPDRNGSPVIAIVAAFAAMTSSPGVHRIFVRQASWRWTRICCFIASPSRWSG